MPSKSLDHPITKSTLTIITKQSLKSGETAVRGDQWPMFLYAGYVYGSEDPWKGLLKSEILIFVSLLSSITASLQFSFAGFQARLYISEFCG
jgi:hypothetical protein